MPYRVDWLPGPMAAQAHIWNHAVIRQAIADAANQIDRVLARTPFTAGAAQGSVFRLHIAPLEVIYTVWPADQRVEVSLVSYRP